MSALGMGIRDSGRLRELISQTKFVHILGAGMNSEKPANTAVSDLSERGWNPIPIHPRDAGASIGGYPIRPGIEDGVIPEVVVLFLAPERAREAVKRLLVTNYDSPALVWFQQDLKTLSPKAGLMMQDGTMPRMTVS